MDLLLALQHASLNPIRRPILLIEESDALEYLQQQGEGSDENAIFQRSAAHCEASSSIRSKQACTQKK